VSSVVLKITQRQTISEVMAQNFEPLQNDLIIRTAWGKFPSCPHLKKFIADSSQVRKSKELLCGLCVKVSRVLCYQMMLANIRNSWSVSTRIS
jgi:hypothetical protein